MDNVRQTVDCGEKTTSWPHDEDPPQYQSSMYTGGSNFYSTWNATQISSDVQGRHDPTLMSTPGLPCDGFTASYFSDDGWQVIPRTEEMAQREVRRDNSSFVANDIVMDTRGLGGIHDYYQPAFSEIAPCTYTQIGGVPDSSIDEYSVSFKSSFRVANETDTYLSTAHPIPPSSSPWSAARPLRVPQYNTGYAAFINGSESPSDKSSYDELPEPHIRQSTTTFKSSEPTEVDDSTNPITARNNIQQFEWRMDGPLVGISSEGMGRTSGEAASGRRGRRKGPLTPEGRQGAHIMRKHHACIRCHFKKVKCSKGKVCDECHKHALSKMICTRSIVECYGTCYFPNVLTSHLRRGQVETLISENIVHFTDVQTTVKVTCGGVFEAMDVTVNIFINKTDELLYHQRLTTRYESEQSDVIIENSAPVGIIGMDEALQTQCKSYNKSIVSNPYYVLQVTAGDPTLVCRDVLQVIHGYFLREKEKDELLDKAMQLHGMHFFMRTLITFTPESAAMLAKADGAVRGVVCPPNIYQSSRLLGRELKYFMHNIHKLNLRKVLGEFETCLKKQEATMWPVCFCVVVILCLCTEDIQIATNHFISAETKIFDQSRPGYHECRDLEELPFAQIFHDAFGTHKKNNGHGNKSSFNPILNCEESQTGWSQNARDMVRGIREVIDNSYLEMRILSQRVVFENNQFRLDYQGFVNDNPGRLLSKFLLSFYE